jgi:hypothetical protein
MALLSAIDVRELERREAEVADREEAVLRREKAIDAVERMHELRGRSSDVAVASVDDDDFDSPQREEQRQRRSGLKDALRIRERDWWIKVLGIAPQA